jgi:hypothetical protein
MTDKINYFAVASFLADIEAEYADISDPVKQMQSLVGRLLSKWPSMTADQAVAYVQVFKQTD